MRTVFVTAAAVAVLVAGGFVYSLVAPPGVADAQEDESTETTVMEDAARPLRPGFHHLGQDFLDELVADDVITQEQADEIVVRLQEKAEELRAEFEARAEEWGEDGFRRGPRFGFGREFKSFLEDGVIDADELAELGDHPLLAGDGPLSEYLEDGQITAEELEELRDGWRDWLPDRSESDDAETSDGA